MNKKNYKYNSEQYIQKESVYINKDIMPQNYNNSNELPGKNNKNKGKYRKILAGVSAIIVTVAIITALICMASTKNKTDTQIKEVHGGESNLQNTAAGIQTGDDKEQSGTIKYGYKQITSPKETTVKNEITIDKELDSYKNTDNIESQSNNGSENNAANKNTNVAQNNNAMNNNSSGGSIKNSSSNLSENVAANESAQIKDSRCNLDVTSEFYKYELAYRTKDASALEGDDLTFYNNLKQALDNAYKYTEPWYQEKEIHDWIVLNATYDIKNYRNNSIPHISYTEYGIFVNKTAVCDGYSKAFKLCMDILGIENQRVIGSALTGCGHAWNMVKLEGEWYQVDCTFDDPVPDYGDVSYDNFNVTDTMMKRNHIYEITTPANGRKYSYYNYFYEGKVAHSMEEYYDELCRAINNNEKSLSIIHYDETSASGMDYKSDDTEYQDYIQVYNRTGRLVQSCVRCKVAGYNHKQLEIEFYEDTSCREVAIGKEDYEKKLAEHMAAGDKNIKMYILDEDYWEGKYIIGENKIIGGRAYAKDEEFRSGAHWSVSWTDLNIVYYITMDLEYLESWDGYYYVSTTEEAKKVVNEHLSDNIYIYFETDNKDKINIKECIKGTTMGIWYDILEQYEEEMGKNEKILENYTIVYLSGWMDRITIESAGQQ